MPKVNKYGLSRTIPADVRREIRRRCGFGCVICGLAYYDYEHFNPDFKEARAHTPDGMTLLCMQCNQKRARRTLSVETVAKATLSPKCRQQGYASELFDFSQDPIEVKFAGVKFKNCDTIIQIFGKKLLSLKPPEEPGSPVLLSGFLTDKRGKRTLLIEDNVWSAASSNWDVEIDGQLITIRRGLRDIALRLRVMPPHSIAIEKIDMFYNGWFLRGDDQVLQMSQDGVSWSAMRTSSISDCIIGIKIG